jgi:uncharacterized lipoprotein NlpE involved in copper resistance
MINPVLAESTADENTNQHDNKLNISGLYLGFTPCPDCKGIKTTLGLNANRTYALYTVYVGKSEREFVEKGKYEWGKKENTIVLTPRKGSSKTQYYLVGEEKLTKLDDDGNLIIGDDADRYVLKRKNMVEDSPMSHSGH